MKYFYFHFISPGYKQASNILGVCFPVRRSHMLWFCSQVLHPRVEIFSIQNGVESILECLLNGGRGLSKPKQGLFWNFTRIRKRATKEYNEKCLNLFHRVAERVIEYHVDFPPIPATKNTFLQDKRLWYYQPGNWSIGKYRSSRIKIRRATWIIASVNPIKTESNPRTRYKWKAPVQILQPVRLEAQAITWIRWWELTTTFFAHEGKPRLMQVETYYSQYWFVRMVDAAASADRLPPRVPNMILSFYRFSFEAGLFRWVSGIIRKVWLQARKRRLR